MQTSSSSFLTTGEQTGNRYRAMHDAYIVKLQGILGYYPPPSLRVWALSDTCAVITTVADPETSEGGGPRNMKYKAPRTAAIFFWPIFYRPGGGGPWPPWPPPLDPLLNEDPWLPLSLWLSRLLLRASLRFFCEALVRCILPP